MSVKKVEILLQSILSISKKTQAHLQYAPNMYIKIEK